MEYCYTVMYGYVVYDRTKSYMITLMSTTTMWSELLMHMFV